jgi:hypothetical protein
MRHWTWADWLETNLLRSDWIFAQLDWAPKKGPATTRDWRTAVHTPSLPGLSMQPQNHYWHQLCTESSELSWISHWPRQNPQQFRYILFKYWCSTLYVMHDFNFNQYQLLINIEQIYAYIYDWDTHISRWVYISFWGVNIIMWGKEVLYMERFCSTNSASAPTKQTQSPSARCLRTTWKDGAMK